MNVRQSVDRPVGVTVMGSHVMQVNPDIAVTVLGINRTEHGPASALAQARDATGRVRHTLRALGVNPADIRASRIELRTKYHTSSQGPREFAGHCATTEISGTLSALDKLDGVLVGAVEAGADEVRSVTFQTTKLREHRIKARIEALRAARSKAEHYAEEAGVRLGKVLHIEDVDPEAAGRRGYHVRGHDIAGADETGAYDPGSIIVAGAVLVSYAIDHESARGRRGNRA
ncbi:MAG: SIMPL domain-containing protein [Myxococcota bacterium]